MIRVGNFEDRVVLYPVALVDIIELFFVRMKNEEFNQEDTIL